MRCRVINSIRKGERGFSLLETMIATGVLLIGVTGLMALFAVAVIKNTNQGTEATRTTEYAQDKMEELMALQYQDETSDTRAIQTISSGGSGLGCATSATDCTAGTYYPGGTSSTNLTIGTCANALYCDYIFEAGQNLTDTTYVATTSTANGSNAQYMRQWQIYFDSNNVKTITVIVSALSSNEVAIGGGAKLLLPNTMLIGQKTNYF